MELDSVEEFEFAWLMFGASASGHDTPRGLMKHHAGRAEHGPLRQRATARAL